MLLSISYIIREVFIFQTDIFFNYLFWKHNQNSLFKVLLCFDFKKCTFWREIRISLSITLKTAFHFKMDKTTKWPDLFNFFFTPYNFVQLTNVTLVFFNLKEIESVFKSMMIPKKKIPFLYNSLFCCFENTIFT